MAWRKTTSNHVPDWLNVLPVPLRVGAWEFVRIFRAGLIVGVIFGVIIGVMNKDKFDLAKVSTDQESITKMA
jgi:hypothetical protein